MACIQVEKIIRGNLHTPYSVRFVIKDNEKCGGCRNSCRRLSELTGGSTGHALRG